MFLHDLIFLGTLGLIVVICLIWVLIAIILFESLGWVRDVLKIYLYALVLVFIMGFGFTVFAGKLFINNETEYLFKGTTDVAIYTDI